LKSGDSGSSSKSEEQFTTEYTENTEKRVLGLERKIAFKTFLIEEGVFFGDREE
jgi:hypothetical protein